MCDKTVYTAFAGYCLVGRGDLEEVVAKCKKKFDEGCSERIVVYDDSTGQMYDFELSGSKEEVVHRLLNHPMLKDKTSGRLAAKSPGRPKLGVISREISLLPRHWEWLNEQSGGASGIIRRLIDEERRRIRSSDTFKKQQAATHRFMWDIAGDMEDFEDASRFLYRSDFENLEKIITTWPEDVFKHLALLLDNLKLLSTEADLEDRKKNKR